MDFGKKKIKYSNFIVLILACPTGCNECMEDSSTKAVMCKDSKCMGAYVQVAARDCVGKLKHLNVLLIILLLFLKLPKFKI